ncbi:hypothetical protein [Halorubrum kocurii]|uniref:hypothetical protein n=1 Tax=Halorubrum kocurii TaxID=478441 RepID=UPI0006782851|nr:hypothetical protein [Halorubrum kocurii]
MAFERTDSCGDELPPTFDGVEPGFDPLSSVSLSPTYDVDRWDAKNQTVELGGEIEYDEETEKYLWALRHFELRIAPACDEIAD